MSELSALYSVLAGIAPSAPTACTEWTAHDLLAHVAAGAKERADLIEEKLAGLPERATKPFAEREARFLALPHEDLRTAVIRETQRFQAAATILSRQDAQATIPFTGTRFTAAQLLTHQRSEAAIHRWDLVGTDEVGNGLLAQPELTRHSVSVLNTLQAVLRESPTARMRHAGMSARRIVLCSLSCPDIVLEATAGEGAFDVCDHGWGEGDAIVTTDVAQRLLIMWGRQPTTNPIAIDARTITRQTVELVLWPAARPWPDDAPSTAGREGVARTSMPR